MDMYFVILANIEDVVRCLDWSDLWMQIVKCLCTNWTHLVFVMICENFDFRL
jgi:hypothetical protein